MKFTICDVISPVRKIEMSHLKVLPEDGGVSPRLGSVYDEQFLACEALFHTNKGLSEFETWIRDCLPLGSEFVGIRLDMVDVGVKPIYGYSLAIWFKGNIKDALVWRGEEKFNVPQSSDGEECCSLSLDCYPRMEWWDHPRVGLYGLLFELDTISTWDESGAVVGDVRLLEGYRDVRDVEYKDDVRKDMFSESECVRVILTGR